MRVDNVADSAAVSDGEYVSMRRTTIDVDVDATAVVS